ncbi:hypothetical protein O181_084600 [Austropuccinia psidii MF-1]|uniref:Uncharacterized protein n=1 Tax=Austropuccinia psidii MF-1 TaxID=1389203 RepID=A0A9Q3IMK1_9BASI|nr:hypothetical protein [Austropuccinia psidii MF-1]
MVRTKPDLEHHHNYLKDDEAIIPPLDVIVRTKPNIEHHEDNNTKSNHERKLNTLPHPYILIDKTNKPFLPFFIYEITTFYNSSGHSQMLKNLIMKLMSLSQNQQEIQTNKKVPGGMMKGIGFWPGSDSCKSSGV